MWGVDGYRAVLVVRDLWDKTIDRRMVRTPNGEADMPWDSRVCDGPCRVEIERELTEREFKELWRDVQLDRIVDLLSGPRPLR